MLRHIDHIRHVRFDVASYDESAAQLAAAGAPATFEADFAQGPGGNGSPLSATYFATGEDLGFTVEIVKVPERFAMPEPELVYPAD